MTALTKQIVNDLLRTIEQYLTYAWAILRTPTHRRGLRSKDLDRVLLSPVRLTVHFEDPRDPTMIEARIQSGEAAILRIMLPTREGAQESWQVRARATCQNFQLERTVLLRPGLHPNNDKEWKKYVVEECLTYGNGDGETSIVLHSPVPPQRAPQLELIRHRAGRQHYAITVAAMRPPWVHPRVAAREVRDADELREAVSGTEMTRWDREIVDSNILSYLNP